MPIMLNGALVTGSKLLIAFSLFFLFSCGKENMGDCFKGTGQIITETRVVEKYFDKVEVEDNINVVLTQAPEFSIKIEAGKNLIDLIETDFTDNALTLRNKNKCNWVRSYNKPITAHISLPLLQSLQYRSSGDVTSVNTFVQDSIAVEIWGGAGSVTMNVDCRIALYALHTGTGDLNISGKTGVSYVWNSGNGFFLGENLETDYTFTGNRGTGDNRVRANVHLGATILHIGNIYYSGEPEIVSDIRGSGRLIKIN